MLRPPFAHDAVQAPTMGPILLGAAGRAPGLRPGVAGTVAESLARAVMQDMRWAEKERHGLTSVEPLHAGVFTVVQRLRSDLGLYVPRWPPACSSGSPGRTWHRRPGRQQGLC